MRIQEQVVTIENALQVKKEGIASIDCGDAEINLTLVKSVDSSAVSVLLSWIRHAKKKNLTLRIRSVPTSLEALLSLYGIHALFESFISSEN